ncbi:MAG: GDSL-type esterase/lipase family protein [Candidatus Aminicenantes bacterium]|nr:GDSL-type esterase/lipase family protein [Candidatus Aminicenantes bacterium]
MKRRTFTLSLVFCALLMTFVEAGGPARQAAQPQEPGFRSTTPADRLAEAWWAERHEAKLQEKASRRVDLIFFGDSITHGWDGSFRPGPERVWSAYYGDRHALNLGFSGDRTEHVLWRLEHGEVDGLTPRAVVLMVGTNNIGHGGQTVEEAEAGVRAVCRSIRRKMPRARLILLAVFPRQDKGWEVAAMVEDLNRRIAPLGREPGTTFLDINRALLEPDGALSREVMYDLLHPGPVGYVRWAEALEPTIRRVFGPRPNTAVIPQPGVEDAGYDWMNRHGDILALQAFSGRDLVFIGDSIFHYWGGQPHSTDPRGREVWDESYAPRRALNLGFGWDRTQQVLWRLENGELGVKPPRVAVVLIGTNNLWPGMVRANTDEETVAGIRAVCEKVRRLSPVTKILLLGLLPRGAAGDFDRWRIGRINRELARLDRKGNVTFLDIGGRLLGPDGSFLPGVTDDALHPTATGYRLIAEAIEPTLDRLLKESSIARDEHAPAP